MSATPFRTFVVADLRGYTRYSAAFGDEAAAVVAVKFAGIAAKVAEASDGELVEVRGDEVLLAYASARQAMRGALELQRRCRGPDGILLPVGAGIDAGEPVAVGEGYRGGSLNLAARLCGIAGPGQTLASDTTVALARRVEGLTLRELRPARLKGIDRQVRAWELDSVEALPPVPTVPTPPRQPRRPRGHRGMALAGLAAVGLLVAFATAVLVVRSRDDAAGEGVDIPANSVVAIDPSNWSIKRVVRVNLGVSPVAVAFGEGAVWTYNSDEGNLIEIDPRSGHVRLRGLGVNPTDVVAGAGSVWIASPATAQILRLDPLQPTADPIALPLEAAASARYGAYGLALSRGQLWVAGGYNNGVVTLDTVTGKVTRDHAPSLQFESFFEISASPTAVWAAENVEAVSAVKLSIPGGIPLDEPVGMGHNGLLGPQDDMVATDKAVWYALAKDDRVYRIDPASPARVIDSIRVGDGPSGIAVDGQGRPWVTNSLSGSIAVIDPRSDDVVKTIALHHTPTSITYGGGLLWVTVQAG